MNIASSLPVLVWLALLRQPRQQIARVAYSYNTVTGVGTVIATEGATRAGER